MKQNDNRSRLGTLRSAKPSGSISLYCHLIGKRIHYPNIATEKGPFIESPSGMIRNRVMQNLVYGKDNHTNQGHPQYGACPAE